MADYRYEGQKHDIERFADMILREKKLAWNDAINSVLEMIDEFFSASEVEGFKNEVHELLFSKEQINESVKTNSH